MSKLGTRPFERGFSELGNDLYAWLQPDGGWGWSSAPCAQEMRHETPAVMLDFLQCAAVLAVLLRSVCSTLLTLLPLLCFH